MTDKILETIKRVQRMAEEQVPKTDQLMPYAHVFYTEGGEERLALIAFPFPDNAAKMLALYQIGKMCREKRAHMLAFLTESYTAKFNGTEQEALEARKKYPDLKDHPESMEIATVIVETVDGAWMSTAQILPGRKLGPWVGPEKGTVRGDFAKVLRRALGVPGA